MLWPMSADNNSKFEVNIFEQNFTQNAGKYDQENIVWKGF